MSSIFISHSSHDNSWAERIRDWLKDEREQRPQEQRFRSLFLDFDQDDGIQAGERWRDQIYEQLQLCAAVVVLCSEAYAASQWCLAELGVVIASGKLVLPVRMATGTPLPKLLSETQATALSVIDLEQGADSGWQRLLKGLEPLSWQSRLPWPPPGEPGASPFPGLDAFERRHAAMFFGQDQVLLELRQTINELPQRQSRLLLILGASGCGKSSLLRAGLVPWLVEADRRRWIVLEPFRPGKQAFEWLHQVVSERFTAVGAIAPGAPARTVEQLGAQLEDLRRLIGQQDARVVIPIDQFEELLGRGHDLNPKLAADADAFLTLLAQLLAMEGSQVLILATLRSDFYGQLQLHPSGLHRLAGRPLPLGPMEPAGFRQVIEGPAQRVGLRLEPGLSDALVHDTTTGDALPLLAFTLQELWEGRGDGLTLQQYEAFGRLAGAVQRKADAVLKKLGPDEASLKALRDAFVQAMVRVSEQGGYARRAAAWDSLPEAARPLLEALVAARLLVRRQKEGQPSTVEVAHEALLRVWPLLRGWLDEDETRDFLLGRQQLEQDLQDWQKASEHERPSALLSGRKLRRAKDWLSERPQQLSNELRVFVQASIDQAEAQERKERRNLRRVMGGLSVLAAIAVAFGLYAWWRQTVAEQAQAKAFAATAEALVATDPLRSLINGLAAWDIVSKNPGDALQLANTLEHAIHQNQELDAIPTRQGRIVSLISLLNGEVMSTGLEGNIWTMKRWGKDGIQIGNTIQADTEEALALVMAKKGEIASVRGDETLKRWGKNHERFVLPSGDLVNVGMDGKLNRWDENGNEKWSIATGHAQGPIQLVALSNDEVATGGVEGEIKRWGKDGHAIGSISTDQGQLTALLTLPKGEILSGGVDGRLKRWRWKNGDQAMSPYLSTEHRPVFALATMPDGDIVSGGGDGMIRRWGQERKFPKQTIKANQGYITSIVGLRNGQLVSSGEDGTIKRWDIHGNQQYAWKPTAQDKEDKVISLMMLPKGSLIMGWRSGALQQLDLDENRLGRRITTKALPPPAGNAQVWTALPHNLVASRNAKGTIELWSLDGNSHGSPIDTSGRASIALLALPTGELLTGVSRKQDRDSLTVYRWDQDGNVIGTLRTNIKGNIFSMLMLPQGDLVIGVGKGLLYRWNVSTIAGRACRSIKGHHALKSPKSDAEKQANSLCRRVDASI